MLSCSSSSLALKLAEMVVAALVLAEMVAAVLMTSVSMSFAGFSDIAEAIAA